jgi:endogenous inhibitor of DNA gyrase (YacG/DUF329 family)
MDGSGCIELQESDEFCCLICYRYVESSKESKRNPGCCTRCVYLIDLANKVVANYGCIDVQLGSVSKML